MRITIHSPVGIRCVECGERNKLSQILLHAGFPIAAPCGGRGTCGKCRVFASGALSEPSEEEKKLLGENLTFGMRLACMCEAYGDCEITLCSDAVYAEAGEYKRFSSCDSREGLGIAVDVGTTTLVFYLYNLRDGTEIGVTSALNPQGIYGGDVISRIESALSGHLIELKRLIIDAVSTNSELLCKKCNVNIQSVTDVVITGNTAMMYLLCGISPEPLAHAPFLTNRFFGEYADPTLFGFASGTRVYLTRSVSAYVGGDITSAATAVALTRCNRTSLLIDIGTNGESMAFCDGKLLCASAAAGPCFEGVGISAGMMAKAGAINSIKKKDGRIVCTTVGGTPTGLCGSGIIDAIALMLDEEIIDENGTFPDGVDDYILPGTNVRVTRGDVRAVQLAKSAICSSIQTLMHRLGVTKFDSVFLAGGFGNNIDPESAFRIGLLPRDLTDNVIKAGNAAGYGASLILMSDAERKYSESIAENATALELSTDPFFAECFIENMCF